jgi:hypothetical protein
MKWFDGIIEIVCDSHTEFAKTSTGTPLTKLLIVRNERSFMGVAPDFKAVRLEWSNTASGYIFKPYPGLGNYWIIPQYEMRKAYDNGYIRVVEQD